MKKKQTVIPENYLEKIPLKKPGLRWTQAADGAVTLEVENTGVANRIAQKLIKKPLISYIHLDEMGNFVWPLIDGENSLIAIGEQVKAHFGEKAEPLYERLAQYFRTLASYGFVEWREPPSDNA